MIGMDHFALPKDALACAKQSKRLFRNFQGYTTNDEQQLLGLGVSAISNLASAFTQNHKHLNDYYASIDEQQLPVSKGCWLSQDDHIRGFVISQLMCNMHISFAEIARRFTIEPHGYFAAELAALQPLEAEGLIRFIDDALMILPHARQLVRAVCSYFDTYLLQPHQYRGYSRVI